MLSISHTELKTWRTCKRKWFLGNYLEWAPGPEESPVGSAQLGIRIHLALEGHYGWGLNPILVLHYLYDAANEERPEYARELNLERGYAITMVEGFLQWSAEEGIDAGYRILAVEREEQQQVTLPSGEPVIFRGKLDQLVQRESDDAILFRDWKTVGTLTKANLLILDSQMRFYAMLQALGSKESGKRADGGLYLMLLRSKRTERAKGPFYQQVEVHLNNNDLNSAWLNSRAVAQEIVTARQRLDNGGDHRETVYPSPGDHCRYACPFLSVCPLMDDGSRWEAALVGTFQHCDPYARYADDRLEPIKAALKGTDAWKPDSTSSSTVIPSAGNPGLEIPPPPPVWF